MLEELPAPKAILAETGQQLGRDRSSGVGWRIWSYDC